MPDTTPAIPPMTAAEMDHLLRLAVLSKFHNDDGTVYLTRYELDRIALTIGETIIPGYHRLHGTPVAVLDRDDWATCDLGAGDA